MSDDNLLMEDDMEISDDEASDDESGDDEGIFDFLPPFFPPFANMGRGSQPAATNRNYNRPGVSMFLTRPQFNASMTKIHNDIAKNSRAIQDVSKRVAAEAVVNSRQTRALQKQSKINTVQSRQIQRLRTDLKKTQDNGLLLAILTQPKTLPATTAAGNIGGTQVPVGTKLATVSGNSLLLPLLLTGGLGGGEGGSDSNSLLLVLALSGGLGL